MDRVQEIQNIIKKTCNSLFFVDILNECWDKIVVEPPIKREFGELTTNAALILSSILKENPLEIASKISTRLKQSGRFKNISIAKPGFINMILYPDFWHKSLLSILIAKEHFGDDFLGKDKTVLVEFVSANPTGPLHIGHCRNAVLGDVISSILEKVGYKVVREYYVNDTGKQVDNFARSVYWRYQELLGTKSSEDLSHLYQSEYIIFIAKLIIEQDGEKWLKASQSSWMDHFKAFSVHFAMKDIQKDLKDLGVHINVFTSEKQLIDKGYVQQTFNLLRQNGDIYYGIPPRTKGRDNTESKPQALFRSTRYGDDEDCPFKNSNGNWTYFASDTAYHLSKIKRGFINIINIFGPDHIGYIKRINAIVKALNNNSISLTVKSCQLVHLFENGTPLKTHSKNFITASEILKCIGPDILRFMMIFHHNKKSINLDLATIQEHSKSSPIFYIQYAYARIHSLRKHCEKIFPNIEKSLTKIPLHLLTDEKELLIVRLISDWPRQIRIAANMLDPHRLATYLYEVASAFHDLWNKGKSNQHLRFIDPYNELRTKVRLALIVAVSYILKSGLTLFGITPIKEMK
ncbi:MAG: arginine--tRNA ligase [Alphaproteobacteria bacterium]